MRSPFHAASPRINSPMHPGGGGTGGTAGAGGNKTPSGGFTAGGGGGMGRGRGRRDNDLIGQTIKITHGPYKGVCGDFCVRGCV